jgi:light-regulated signal transduction histidine kinase (bacteriophytochrome)
MISVIDNGIGFSNEYAEQIFTIFQRLNERTKYAGYGIGLAVCKKIVENHEGVIFARGKVREGANFTFLLSTDII